MVYDLSAEQQEKENTDLATPQGDLAAPQGKQGAKFCGCCDMRRAICILSGLGFIIYCIGLWQFRSLSSYYPFDDLYEDILTPTTVLYIIGLVGCALSIISAIKFNAIGAVSSFQRYYWCMVVIRR